MPYDYLNAQSDTSQDEYDMFSTEESMSDTSSIDDTEPNTFWGNVKINMNNGVADIFSDQYFNKKRTNEAENSALVDQIASFPYEPNGYIELDETSEVRFLQLDKLANSPLYKALIWVENEFVTMVKSEYTQPRRLGFATLKITSTGIALNIINLQRPDDVEQWIEDLIIMILDQKSTMEAKWTGSNDYDIKPNEPPKNKVNKNLKKAIKTITKKTLKEKRKNQLNTTPHGKSNYRPEYEPLATFMKDREKHNMLTEEKLKMFNAWSHNNENICEIWRVTEDLLHENKKLTLEAENLKRNHIMMLSDEEAKYLTFAIDSLVTDKEQITEIVLELTVEMYTDIRSKPLNETDIQLNHIRNVLLHLEFELWSNQSPMIDMSIQKDIKDRLEASIPHLPIEKKEVAKFFIQKTEWQQDNNKRQEITQGIGNNPQTILDILLQHSILYKRETNCRELNKHLDLIDRRTNEMLNYRLPTLIIRKIGDKIDTIEKKVQIGIEQRENIDQFTNQIRGVRNNQDLQPRNKNPTKELSLTTIKENKDEEITDIEWSETTQDDIEIDK